MVRAAWLMAVLVLVPATSPGDDAGAIETGPWPDFGPTLALATHDQLDHIHPDLAPAITDALGGFHVVEDNVPPDFVKDAGHLLWMRDFTPIYVRSERGVTEWTPLAERAVRREARSEGWADPFPGRAEFAEDGAAMVWTRAERTASSLVARRSLPLVLEGGNLVSTGRWAFLTEGVFEDNRRELNDADPEDRLLAKAGYRPRSDVEVQALLTQALALPPSRVVVLPPLPGEATGHVDLFVMALGPDTVMVPRIDDEAIAAAAAETDREQGANHPVEDPALLAEVTASFLDHVADRLDRRGLSVRRWPMLPPQQWQSLHDDDPGAVDVLFLSPANGVLSDGPGGPRGLMPSFQDPDLLSARLRALQTAYEDIWSSQLEDVGFEPVFVEATELSRYLGLLRCVTAPIPSLTGMAL